MAPNLLGQEFAHKTSQHSVELGPNESDGGNYTKTSFYLRFDHFHTNKSDPFTNFQDP